MTELTPEAQAVLDAVAGVENHACHLLPAEVRRAWSAYQASIRPPDPITGYVNPKAFEWAKTGDAFYVHQRSSHVENVQVEVRFVKRVTP